MREVDRELSANPKLQQRVREIHPELCFWAWNGQEAMRHSKKKAKGRAEREALVKAFFGADALTSILTTHRRKHVGRDDILDAFAALWTAERIHRGMSQVIPESPPLDANGLRVEMWY